ncbi:malto-oligosyltrehalose synthase [Micrococcoides hystricis]|uniref:Malto-oligosyltrehalose synthase n=1 Tax=Micrococcoides hystricis TaxID=1572761 RepID=A0ABV6P933_9MICC
MSAPHQSPTNTYRLQITADFTLEDAKEQLPYLRSLGIDWLYLSPLLDSESGSDHGYDVVNPQRIDTDRGGRFALEALADDVHQHGGGVLVDIVPNHVGVATPEDNPFWWDVLMHGQESEHACFFDIDFDAHDGKIFLPVLGSEDDLDQLSLGPGGFEIYGNKYPVAPGTADDVDFQAPIGPEMIREVLSRQNYVLADWRRGDTELNYRRFFTITSLAGVRVEDPTVFEATHRRVGQWIRDGWVDGLRVDHPDGLADPSAYFDQLQTLFEHQRGYVVVEKILENGEVLPMHWPVAGTTGYDALAHFDRVLNGSVHHEGRDHSVAIYNGLLYAAQREVTDGPLAAEFHRLARECVSKAGLQADHDELLEGLRQIAACLDVYRSYLPAGEDYLDEAFVEARERSAATGWDLNKVYSKLYRVLTDPQNPVAIRFQQTTGMVMAKGAEDRAFYRFCLLSSLNEVGAEPAKLSLTREEFHQAQAERQAAWPTAMTCLSTHDTKRSEDVRARINALTQLSGGWRKPRMEVLQLFVDAGVDLLDDELALILLEAAIGAWSPETRITQERLLAYAHKAARENGRHTSWIDQNADYEQSLEDFVALCYQDGPIRERLEEIHAHLTEHAVTNSLAAKALQLSAPGVPDVYQGCEIFDYSLVDPDNRRPVDYSYRQDLLNQLSNGWQPTWDEASRTDRGADGLKLLLTSTLLRLRRDERDRFQRYRPLLVSGERKENLLAFDRGGLITAVTRGSGQLANAGGWGETKLLIDSGHYTELLTGERLHVTGPVLARELFASYPVALLYREYSL